MHDKLKTFKAYKSNRRLICYFNLTPTPLRGSGAFKNKVKI